MLAGFFIIKTRSQILEKKKTIAIQGFAGCFHEVAAQQFFGKQVAFYNCATFTELAVQTAKGILADAAVMAIENSIAGSILPNYELIQRNNLVIMGEIYLPIKQQLLAKKGVQLSEITEVHSHPMALQQCSTFLNKFNLKLVESDDTALSAKMVAQRKDKHVAAVASLQAASLYGLDVIGKNIHNEKTNYTRFLVLSKQSDATLKSGANKMSVKFSVDNSRGSLSKTLSSIAKANGNLTKLQSFPIPGGNWQYAFYADVEFANEKIFSKLLKAIQLTSTQFQLLGVYVSGLKK